MAKKQQNSEDGSAPMFDLPASDEQTPPKAAAIQPSAAATCDVEASSIVPNSECIFTEGCRGRIYAYSTVKCVVDGVQEVRQQLRCNRCGKVAKGYRLVGLPGDRRLYDRHAGR